MADAMTQEGFRWDRFTVSNIENGRRAAISVEEWLALARVLHVAPIHLVVPIEDDGSVQVTPHIVADVPHTRAWVRGQNPFLVEGDHGSNPEVWTTYERHKPTDEALDTALRLRLGRSGDDGGDS